MLYNLSDWVKRALDHASMLQSDLARRLAAELERSVDRTAVNKVIHSSRALLADEMLAIAEITGYPLPQVMASRLDRRR